MLKAGRLRHRVTIQKIDEGATSTTGVLQGGYSYVAEVWAEILELRGREFISHQEEHSQVTAKIRIRYRDDIKSHWRILYKTRTFEIVAPPINLQGLDRALELMVQEIDP